MYLFFFVSNIFLYPILCICISHSVGLEHSPPSPDAKMDIADENTMQDFSYPSPSEDDEDLHSPMVGYPEKTETNRNNLTLTGNDTNFLQMNDDSLDNRKPNGLYLDITRSSSAAPLSSSPRSALTLANSHPLMFPDSSSFDNDSDSEQEPKPFKEVEQILQQPLRLGQPMMVTDVKDTITTTGFSSRHTLTTLETNRLLNLVPNNKKEHADKDIVEFGSSDDELDVASEPDISQYQANVNPHYQSVVLVSRPDHHQPTTNFQRKIPVSADLLSDSMSSLDSMSQNSFDEDLENNLVSVSISSSVLDDTGFNAGEGATGGGLDDVASPVSLPTDHMTTPIPQYSATEEARDTRSWQKITLPDGRTREIDMKVIEPYKRVLSHGGYLNSGGHNAIVVFSACHLPDRSRKDYHYVMDNLFL